MSEAAVQMTPRPRTQEVCAPMPRQYTSTPPPERFWMKVDFNGPVPVHRPELGPCWLWKGSTATYGYGTFWDGECTVRAHRWAYVFCVGPIPEGLTLDHLCRVRHCVLSDHLEAVTSRVNILRGEGATAQHARQTHCPQGHPYSGSNLLTLQRASGNVGRGCRLCANAARRKRGKRPSL